MPERYSLRARCSSLRASQGHILDTLYHGPGHCPEDLFAGPAARTLMGLKAHANTISHARLVALEETYPRTLQRLDRLQGEGSFNALSRDFIARDSVRAQPLIRIGKGFGGFLAARGCDAASADLARIELGWLESYHAADVAALDLAALAGIGEAALMALPLALHPAARLVPLTAPVARELTELADWCRAAAIMVTRPDAEVQLHPCDAATAQLVARFRKEPQNCRTMRNLLQHAAELPDIDAQTVVTGLIGAGVWRRAD